MNIILGTAQLGLDYGVSNSSGQVSFDEAKKILTCCKNFNINHFDTARSYGQSESILGKLLGSNSVITTKIPKKPDNQDIYEWTFKNIYQSILSLGRSQIDELLFHNSEDILQSDKKIVKKLFKDLKDKNLVKKIGLSVYEFDKFHYLLEHFDIDIIQAPFNIIDRRLAEEGWLNTLKSNSVRVDVRSSFLQGLVFMNNSERNIYFHKWSHIWDELDSWKAANKELSVLDLCLGFIKSFYKIDNIVVGTQSAMQLEEVLLSFHSSLDMTFPDISSSDNALINPSQWRVL
jgi:aryl-alcohol dehydrogenase-like predicted oxidoreductase